jgi:hypothetical protein
LFSLAKVMVLIFFQLTYIKNYQEFWLVCQGGERSNYSIASPTPFSKSFRVPVRLEFV